MLPSADTLHRNALVIDGHCDFLYESLRTGRRLADDAEAHITLRRLQQGGYSAQVFALFEHWAALSTPQAATVRALCAIEAFYAELESHPRLLRPARTAADIESAQAKGQIACLLSIEGAEPLAGDVRLLRTFHRLGVRSLGLVWNYRNRAADGLSVDNPGGLTDFGRALVREAERLGVLVDIAHLSPPGVDDVFRLASRPVIASHANAFAVCPHRRNLTDRQLDMLAASGGVIGVTFVPQFIAPGARQATLRQLVAHIVHIRQRIGAQHIAIGSDFEGYSGLTVGLEHAGKLPALTAALLEAGFTPSEVEGILGGNFLRVLKAVAG
ncbi:MAG: membrane dipeptidase [Caldilineae bacterium]|nr:MAG: membrane dipeptidase [Caldilineae bacterium]